MNYFEPEWVAGRYARARPDVHTPVVAYLRERLASLPLAAALDVGCGTGLSTRPLRALARRVIGLDPARFMLSEAVHAGGAHFALGRAEQLPFPDASFELLTIGCAWHWCETGRFLDAAARVLRPSGHLVVYDNFLLDETRPATELFDWLSTEWWPGLPRTPRNPLPDESFDHTSFEVRDVSSTALWVPMSREELRIYLTTQSGVTHAVESGARSLDELESVLAAKLPDFVPEAGIELRFGGPIWLFHARPG